MEFLEAPAFTRHIGAYLDDAGLLALQLFLIDHPEAGKIMPGTGGFRKLRWGDDARRDRRGTKGSTGTARRAATEITIWRRAK